MCSAAAFGFADVDMVVNAGRDVVAIAAGDLEGMYTAGRDMGLAGYGKVGVLAEVGRDIPWVWARGDLEGTYLVGRHVKDLFSHGEIYAHVDAGTNSNSRILSVESVGKLDGHFVAGLSIDHVRSGDAVVATLIAPTVATPIEYDATLADENPYPDTPTADLAGVLADAANSRDQVLAAKATEIASRDQRLVDHAAERTQVAAQLAQERTDTLAEHDQLVADAPGELADHIAEAESDYAQRRADAADDEALLLAEAAAKLAEAQQDRTDDIAEGTSKYNASKAEVAQAVEEAQAGRFEINVKRGEAFMEMHERQARGTNWTYAGVTIAKEAIASFVAAAIRVDDYPQYARDYVVDAWHDATDRARGVHDLALDQGASRIHALYQAFGVFFYDNTGAMGVFRWATGEDPVTLQKYTGSEALYHGVLGVGQLISTAIAGANLLHLLKGPCGGMIFRRCFVADTQVVVAQGIAGTTEVYADLGSSTPDVKRLAASGLGVVCMLVATGGVVNQICSRRKRRDAELRRVIDDLFASGDLPRVSDSEDDWLDSIPDPLPHPSDHDLDELCEQLFSPEGDIGKPSRSVSDDAVVADRVEDPLRRNQATPSTEVHRIPTHRPIRGVDKPQREGETERRESAMSTAQIHAKIERKPTPARGRITRCFALLLLGLLGSLLTWWGLGSGEQPAAAAPKQPAFQYETRAIQDIREGDVVLARDEQGHAIGLKQVVETYQRTSDHLRILTFESDDGTRQTLKTTNEHPFWVVGRREFIEAEKLSIGDKVTGPNGELQAVVATIYEPHPEGIAVFNLQVDDYHTYFVRENGARAPPTLVHNADYVPGGADDLVRVRSYTDEAGKAGISNSGHLRPDSWVTLADEIPGRAGHLQVEELLEIQRGRGSHYLEFDVPRSNLRVPDNGTHTSGGALQFQLNEAVDIDPSEFLRSPGRPVGS